MWTRPLLYFSRGRARQAAALCPAAGNDPVLLMVFTHPPMVFCTSDLVPRACVHFIWKLCSVDLIWLRPLDTSKWFLPQLQRHINGSKKPSLIYFIYFFASYGSVVVVSHISHWLHSWYLQLFLFSNGPFPQHFSLKLCRGTWVAKCAPYAFRQPLIWGVTRIITGLAERLPNQSMSFLSKGNHKQRH